MSWRPKDWEEILQETVNHTKYRPGVPISNWAFEVGADALLKAIWKLAEKSPTGTFTFDSHTINIYGGKGE